jgi:hypothetical protein
MVAPKKYPDELRQRAVRMVLDAKQDPLGRSGRRAHPAAHSPRHVHHDRHGGVRRTCQA